MIEGKSFFRFWAFSRQRESRKTCILVGIIWFVLQIGILWNSSKHANSCEIWEAFKGLSFPILANFDNQVFLPRIVNVTWQVDVYTTSNFLLGTNIIRSLNVHDLVWKNKRKTTRGALDFSRSHVAHVPATVVCLLLSLINYQVLGRCFCLFQKWSKNLYPYQTRRKILIWESTNTHLVY